MDSARIRSFLETGVDRRFYNGHVITLTNHFVAGTVVIPTRPDMPRGLNQLGNTCYLNSLLQVRAAVSAIFE